MGKAPGGSRSARNDQDERDHQPRAPADPACECRSLQRRFVAQPCREGQQRIVIGLWGSFHRVPAFAGQHRPPPD